MKFNSVVPLASCILGLCSLMAWKEASWVNVPSVSVSRQGSVMPFLVCSLFTTFAVRRNCLICSLVRVGSSDAVTKCVQVRHTTVARNSLRRRKSSMYIGIPSPELCEQSTPETITRQRLTWVGHPPKIRPEDGSSSRIDRPNDLALPDSEQARCGRDGRGVRGR